MAFEINIPKSELEKSPSGEVFIPNSQLVEMPSYGFDALKEAIENVIRENPGYEFVSYSDLDRYGVTIKWRKVK